MSKKMAVNVAATSLRAAKIPTQQRTYTVASVINAAATIIASNSPQHKRQSTDKTDTPPLPNMVVTPWKVATVESSGASVMTVGAKTLEEQMQEVMKKLEQVMKDNEEKNKKIDELQRELVVLGKQKVEEANAALEVKEAETKILSTEIVNNDNLQQMIASAVKSQLTGDSSSGLRYTKPYTRRIDDLRMPQAYQPPNFQQFDGKGNPKQHIAHFVETCSNAGTEGDLLVKQFVRSLKGIAFDWYTDIDAGSIDSWDQMEDEFLNRFYSTRRVVSMSELTNTKQWENEPVVEYINRWRALSLECKDRISEMSAVGMCIDGMNWDLLYILKGIKPRSFQELATRAHDMEITIKGHGKNRMTSAKVSVEKREFKKAEKVNKGISHEAMIINTNNIPIKI